MAEIRKDFHPLDDLVGRKSLFAGATEVKHKYPHYGCHVHQVHQSQQQLRNPSPVAGYRLTTLVKLVNVAPVYTRNSHCFLSDTYRFMPYL
jgi:hypothetical protein